MNVSMTCMEDKHRECVMIKQRIRWKLMDKKNLMYTIKLPNHFKAAYSPCVFRCFCKTNSHNGGKAVRLKFPRFDILHKIHLSDSCISCFYTSQILNYISEYTLKGCSGP
ncbi:hypothetical protein RF11_10396 [Thelohanellus kitauei]|uniref:Uncharacterized protein n=1 Tax=Thelohanellus kitauei TaxID=669202 RepID=A0A0C2JZA2_THEKT|nr:hypothetical protein RF11_10396 [Thelohanellus kitauei]